MLYPVSGSYSIEQGFILESHVGEGTVRVRTVSGRVLENARLASMLAGPGISGVSAMPLPNTECLVFTSESLALVIGLFPPPADRMGLNDPSSETLPGEFRFQFESAHAGFSPDGTFDLMAHPWCRSMYIGREHLLKEHIRQWERLSSPFNLMRSINSAEHKASLYELFVNDKFLYREGDQSANIIWTLGRNHPDMISKGNPESPFLSFFQVERRLDSTAEAIGRSSTAMGLVEGVSRHETDWVKEGDVAIESKQGHFEQDGNTLVEHQQIKKGSDVVHDIQVFESGKIIIKNPSWTVTLQEDKVAIIESESTRFKMNGERIEVGLNGVMEPMVLGDTLVDCLNQVINWILTHSHTTPAGISTPAIQAAALSAIQSSFGLASGSPNSKITSNANYVSGGSKYPSGGEPDTA